MIYSYAYRSTPTVAGDAFEANLANILDHSRWWNSENDVTGALLAWEGGFVQILEGSQATIAVLIDNLRCDCRHRSMQSLLTEFRSERRFSRWAMARVPASASDLQLDELSFSGSDRVQPLIERMAELAEA